MRVYTAEEPPLNKIRDNEKGAAVIYAVMFLFVMSFFSFMILQSVNNNLSTSKTLIQQNMLQGAVDTAISNALWNVNNNKATFDAATSLAPVTGSYNDQFDWSWYKEEINNDPDEGYLLTINAYAADGLTSDAAMEVEVKISPVNISKYSCTGDCSEITYTLDPSSLFEWGALGLSNLDINGATFKSYDSSSLVGVQGTPTQNIEFVGSATTNTSTLSLTSLSGGTRTAAQPGDFVLVVSGRGIDEAASNNITISGYTNIANLVSNPTTANGDDLYLDVAYKYLTAADTSISITNGLASIAFVFSGVSSTNPLDVTPTITNDSQMLPAAPAITPVTQGTWIVSTLGIGSDTNNGTFSNTTLTRRTSTANTRTHVGMAYHSSWTSGSFTPTGWSTSDNDSTGSGAAVTIALRPEVGSGTVYNNSSLQDIFRSDVAFGSNVSISNDSNLRRLVSFNDALCVAGTNEHCNTIPEYRSELTTNGIPLAPVSVGASTITYVGGNTAVSSSSISLTSLSGGAATAPSAGDLVLVTIASGVNNGTTSTLSVSGYTQVANLVSDPTGANGDDLYLYVGYKYLTAADTSVTISGGLSLATTIAVQVWRGVNPTTPLDVAATTVTDVVMLPTAPSITPVTTGAVVISAIGIGSDTTNRVFSHSTMDNVITIGDSSSTNQESHVGMAYKAWTSGTYNPSGWSTNDPDGSGSGAAVTLALRPAAGSTGSTESYLESVAICDSTSAWVASTSNGLLNLTGDVCYSSMTFDADTTVVTDGPGEHIVFVNGDVNISQDINVNSTGDAKALRIIAGGTVTVPNATAAGESVVHAYIAANTVNIGNDILFYGALYADDLTIGSSEIWLDIAARYLSKYEPTSVSLYVVNDYILISSIRDESTPISKFVGNGNLIDPDRTV